MGFWKKVFARAEEDPRVAARRSAATKPLFVRGSALARFVDNGDGTITDSRSGLMWQQRDDGVERSYDDAVAYCRGLMFGGYSDWRLPTVEDLLSIVATGTPTNHAEAFAGAKRERYWTVSGFPGHEKDTAYTVDFADGAETSYFKFYKYYVRAVRR